MSYSQCWRGPSRPEDDKRKISKCIHICTRYIRAVAVIRYFYIRPSHHQWWCHRSFGCREDEVKFMTDFSSYRKWHACCAVVINMEGLIFFWREGSRKRWRFRYIICVVSSCQNIIFTEGSLSTLPGILGNFPEISRRLPLDPLPPLLPRSWNLVFHIRRIVFVYSYKLTWYLVPKFRDDGRWRHGDPTTDVKGKITMEQKTTDKMIQRHIWTSEWMPLKLKLCIHVIGVSPQPTLTWRLDEVAIRMLNGCKHQDPPPNNWEIDKGGCFW